MPRENTRRSKEPLRRPGGRSARVVDAVLRATLSEIDRVGYAAMRVEDVAVRSGVNKTTVYRRWPTKAALVTSAIQLVKAPTEIADTGDLARDLSEAFVAALCRAETPELRGLLRMVQTERGNPEVDALVQKLRETQADGRRARLRSAMAAGDLPKTIDLELVQQLLANAIFGPLLRLGQRVEADYVRKAVDLILAGARASTTKRR